MAKGDINPPGTLGILPIPATTSTEGLCLLGKNPQYNYAKDSPPIYLGTLPLTLGQ